MSISMVRPRAAARAAISRAIERQSSLSMSRPSCVNFMEMLPERFLACSSSIMSNVAGADFARRRFAGDVFAEMIRD